MNENEIKAVAVTHPTRGGQRFDEIILIVPRGKDITCSDISEIAVKDRNIIKKEYYEDTIEIMLSADDEGAKELWENPATARKPEVGAPFNPAMIMPLTEYVKPQAQVLFTMKGKRLTVETSEVRECIVDDFKSEHAYRLMYNLFSPKERKENERFPLVIFIPDASVNQNDPRLSLLHGEGATGFAYPRVQDINPSFILAFQIPPRIAFVSDDFTCAEEFDDLKKIIDDVCRENPIDVNRIYILGGSQGCMSACELNCRYPDFFAASVLAGGQWDSEKMGKCCPGCNFWIFVSDGDVKAYPGMNAVTSALSKGGAKVRTYYLNARDSKEKKEEAVRLIAESDANVKFTVFSDHSVVPANAPDTGGTNHMNTWPEVYSYDELKLWLFRQHK
ncbi:Predicted peptidase [Butyrivibrio fibrisolvens]|uniref:Predicted peptidase n=1 Tax=Butyrivibrio fibrisolvens TaxID=831 RepID=A0A1H9VGT3_BUTFI|nr:hypothetical protein [Butyrivibrio fibrisolvens]SES20684.1 Predicted peptidase [Butyrivibrio fibrisolvens]